MGCCYSKEPSDVKHKSSFAESKKGEINSDLTETIYHEQPDIALETFSTHRKSSKRKSYRENKSKEEEISSIQNNHLEISSEVSSPLEEITPKRGSTRRSKRGGEKSQDTKESKDEEQGKKSKLARRWSSRKPRRASKKGGKECEDVGEMTYEVVEVLPTEETWDRLSVEDTFSSAKAKLIPNFDRMRSMDMHALKALQSVSRSVPQLVNYLVKPARCEVEKARVMFRWVAENIEYDLTFNHAMQSPADVLRTGRAVCQGYSALYQQMCKCAGLECETISGVSKGAGYYPDCGATIQDYAHAWSRVRIDEDWYLCDATWAAGGVDYSRDKRGSFRKRWDETWFLVDPEIFIFRHLPTVDDTIDVTRQYINNPYTDLDAWNLDLYVNPIIKGLGLEPVNPQGGAIFTSDNKSTVQILCGSVGPAIFFYATLQTLTGEEVSGHSMLYYAEGHLVCDLRLPARGDYVLQVYVREEALDVELHHSVLPLCVMYTVRATGPQEHPPYPDMTRWGIFPDMLATGCCIVGYEGPVVRTLQGVARVTLQLPTGALCPLNVQLLNSHGEKQAPNCVYLEREGARINIHVVCLERGECLLALYAKIEEGDTFEAIAKLLVDCNEPAPRTALYPFHMNTWPYGALGAIIPLGMKILSPKSSTVVTNSGATTVTFTYKRPLLVVARLMRQDGAEYGDEQSRYICIEKDELHYNIRLRIPDAGRYKLDVFGGEMDEDNLVHLAAFLVDVDRAWAGPLFIKHYGFWGMKTDQMRLLQPSSSTIVTNNGSGTIKIKSFSSSNILHKLSDAEDNVIDSGTNIFATFESDNVLVYAMRFAKCGFYKLEIYSGPQGDSQLNNVGNLLIQIEKGWKGELFPSNTGMWGLNDKARVQGVEVLGIEEAVISMPKPGTQDFRVKCPPDMAVMCDVTSRDSQKQFHSSSESDLHLMKLTVPEKGLHVLKLWVQQRDRGQYNLFGSFLIVCGVKFTFE